MLDSSGFLFDSEYDGNLPIDKGVQVLSLIYSSKSGPFRIMSGIYYGRRVAIKCLKEEFASSMAHINLLRREGELWSTLHHVNIVQVFSVRDVESLGLSIIMEYVEAPTLAEFLKGRSVSFSEARRLLESICDTVEYIHSSGVVHRDLKPENILILPETLQIKIIDFGLSHGKSFADFPISGGTYNFSAPEQFDKEAVAAPSADVWSVGKLMNAIYRSEYAGKAGAFFHPAAKAWEVTARQCLELDPCRRPASAAAVKTLFEQRLKRYAASRILILSCAAAAIAAVIFLPAALNDNAVSPPATGPGRLPAEMSQDSLLIAGDSVAEMEVTSDSTAIAALDTINATADKAEAPDGHDIDPFYSNDYELKDYVNVDGETKFITMKLSDPVPREFVAFLRPTINKHFQWQLNLCKTLTTQEQAQLAYVGHWQYRASAAISDWLKKRQGAKKITEGEYLVLLSFAHEMIETFIKAHEGEESNAILEMARRTGFTFDQKWTEPYNDRDDLIKVHEFQQDGKWHEYTTYKKS